MYESAQKELFLVMEYLAKGALSDFLRKQDIKNNLSTQELISMCVNVAAGMMYLEQKNIIHR